MLPRNFSWPLTQNVWMKGTRERVQLPIAPLRRSIDIDSCTIAIPLLEGASGFASLFHLSMILLEDPVTRESPAEDHPLSWGQRALWMAERLAPGEAPYNLAAA